MHTDIGIDVPQPIHNADTASDKQIRTWSCVKTRTIVRYAFLLDAAMTDGLGGNAGDARFDGARAQEHLLRGEGRSYFPEDAMNRNTTHTGTGKTGKDESILEKVAQAIDPPSREISDEEILDPGKNIPRAPMDKLDENRAPRNRR
jgi:hypothetical protein